MIKEYKDCKIKTIDQHKEKEITKKSKLKKIGLIKLKNLTRTHK